MSYEHDGLYEWPYVGVSPNRDWLINKVKDLESRLDGIVEDAVKLANEYTDERVAAFQSQVDNLRRDVNQAIIDLGEQYDAFTAQINARLVFIQDEINDLSDALAADISAVYAWTERAIQQNNDYILSHLEESLSRITVLNYFTGTRYTVQDMFNYLCLLHVENGITYTELATRNKTYTELAAYNMTYTQLAQNGGAIIV